MQLLADLPSYYHFPPSPTPIKINPSKKFSFPTAKSFVVTVHMDKQIQLTFLDSLEMGLMTDMQTYKSHKLVVFIP
jgi:hypothetical protein